MKGELEFHWNLSPSVLLLSAAGVSALSCCSALEQMPHCNFLLLLASLLLFLPLSFFSHPPSPSLRPVPLLFSCKPLMVISCTVLNVSLCLPSHWEYKCCHWTQSCAVNWAIDSPQMNGGDTVWECGLGIQVAVCVCVCVGRDARVDSCYCWQSCVWQGSGSNTLVAS